MRGGCHDAAGPLFIRASTFMESMAPFFAFLLAAIACRVLTVPALTALFLDQPNERSLHRTPVPRTGGIGVMLGIGLAAMLVSRGQVAVAVLLATGLALVSLIDDWRGLSPGLRLLVQLAAAGVLAATVLGAESGPRLLAAVLAVVWMTNLYNFMDGADGLAGGMAVFGFGAYAAAALMAGDSGLAMLGACIGAAAAGFLLFNFPPARMFMGDVGSIPLGFLAAAIGLIGWDAQAWPAWFPVAAFAPFVVDATVTLVRRLLRGEHVWQAHRSHYYQRQVLLGWSHRRLALVAYLLMAASAATALAMLRLAPGLREALAAVMALAYAALMLHVDLRWARREQANG